MTRRDLRLVGEGQLAQVPGPTPVLQQRPERGPSLDECVCAWHGRHYDEANAPTIPRT